MPIHTIFVHVCAEIASVSVQEVLQYLPFKKNTKALMERTEHNSSLSQTPKEDVV